MAQNCVIVEFVHFRQGLFLGDVTQFIVVDDFWHLVETSIQNGLEGVLAVKSFQASRSD